MPEMLRYLVCYDISDDKTRLWMARRLLPYGQRIQESVFECFLVAGEIESIILETGSRFVDGDEVAFYRLCQDCASGTISSSGRRPEPFRSYLIL